MHLRWKFRAGDDDPTPPPAPPAVFAGNHPTTHPTTAPTTVHAQFASGTFESAAAIVGDVVYVADTAGAVRAIDLATGKLRWIFQSEERLGTTPLVIDGRVFIGALTRLFYALSTETGKMLWKFDSGSEVHCSANYLGAHREHIVFGNDGADIYCLDAATGKVVWNKKSGAQIYGTPAVSNGSALVSGCDAQLRAFNGADGKEGFVVDLGAPCAGSAAVAGDRLVLGTDQGRVLCISAKKQDVTWTFDKVEDQAWAYGSRAVSGNITVFGARDRKVYALDLTTGSKLWTFTTRGDVDSSPVISAGRVYVGSKDKKLYVLDLKTGAQLWSFTAGRGILGSPAIAHGVVVIGDTGGNLFCLE